MTDLAKLRPMRGVAPKRELTFPFYASPKVDGMRAMVKDGVVYSKTMKPIPCPTVHALFGHLHGVDGELVVGLPYATESDGAGGVFERSRGPIMRKTEQEADFRFYVFDRWDLHDQAFEERYRRMYLELLPPTLPTSRSRILDQRLVVDQEELDAYLAHCMESGYEGCMLRDPTGRYKFGQSTEKEGYLLKIKPMATSTAIILEVVEQMTNTNAAEIDELGYTKRSASKAGKIANGTFGAFLVRDLTTGAEFSVGNGPGLTHEKRAELWDMRDTMPGQYIEYRYQAIGTQDAPRLPQLLHLRDAIDISETIDA